MYKKVKFTLIELLVSKTCQIGVLPLYYLKKIYKNNWDAKRKVNVNSHDTSFNTTASVAGKMEKNRWIVDVTIPFKSIGIKDGSQLKGKYFKANFYRYRSLKTAEPDTQRLSCWSPTGQFLHYFPSKFGKIHFEGE